MNKISTFLLFVCLAFVTLAQNRWTELEAYGYLAQPLETKSGVVVSNNNYSELYLVQNNKLETLVRSRGCGLYAKVNKTNDLVGFKSINERGQQAPAILDVRSGKVTLLEPYTFQCGQVSFSNDGTMAYTMGNELVIRKGNSSKKYNLGFYTNLTEISPDASKVAYTNADGEMFVINLLNSVSTQLSANNMFNPKWSHDGSKLAFDRLDGNINVFDFATKEIHNIGEGCKASWIKGTNNLVYTRYTRDAEFEIQNVSIESVQFDGSNKTVLVEDMNNIPQDAIVLSDKRLLIPYCDGKKKGLRIKSLNVASNGRLRFSNKPEETLLRIPVQDEFGYDFKSFKEILKANPKQAQKRKGIAGNIGINDIPYINQIFDTPTSYNGCTSWGHWACAPSTSCMLLGYYGLLPKDKTVTSRYTGNAVYYSWYVGRDYTSPQTGYTFKLRKNNVNGCSNVGGAHGYMWNGGSPSSRMARFYQHNGVDFAEFRSGWSTFVNEVKNGYPYSICLQNASQGHLVLGFRADAEVHTDMKVYYKRGSFICHDPYGDYNDYYNYVNGRDWDGRYATYDWPGFNNGWKNIKTFYWGCICRHNKASVTTIIPSQSTIHFSGVEKNQSKSVSIQVNAKNLTGNIAVSSSNSAFTVSPASLPKTGGNLTITFFPKAIQNYNGTIKLTSGSVSAEVAVSGSGVGKAVKLEQGWNFSEINGINTNGATWLKSDHFGAIRNMTFGYGKLYVTFQNSRILVLDARTGALKRELNNTGVAGGAIPIADCKYSNGKIVACNITSNTNGPLKVYVWDNDKVSTTPRVLLSTSDWGTNVTRIGDCIGLMGDLNNGTLYFGGTVKDGGTLVVKYKITNGVCSTHPQTLTLKDEAGKAMNFGVSPRIQPNADGKFWADGRAQYPTLFDANGNIITTLSSDVCERNTEGNDFKSLSFGGMTYGFTTNYEDNSMDPTGTLKKCAFTMFDCMNGWAAANQIGERYPAAGLGTTRNINCATSIVVNSNGDEGFEVWVMAQAQGLAYFKTGTVKQYSDEGEEATPAVNVSANVLNFSTEKGKTVTQQVTISGTNLKEDINLNLSGTNADLFSISTSKISKAAASVTVTVTYSPNTAGNHSAELSIQTAGVSKVVTLNGQATEKIKNENLVLAEQWNFSQNSGQTANWITNGKQITQDLTFANENLYVVHRNSGSDNKIYIVNPFNGTKIGEMNISNCTVGTYLISSIENLGGKVVACNLATGTTSPLRVYKWDNDNNAPEILLETTSHLGVRTGDAMSVDGDSNNGKIVFAVDSRVFYYAINNGVCAKEPTIINLTKDGKAFNFNDANTYSNVVFDYDGSFWVSSKANATAHFKANGEFIEGFSNAAIGGSHQGTDAKFLKLGTKKYAFVTTYLNKTNTSLAEGALSIIDITNGIDAKAPKQIIPANGLGATRNTSFRNTVCVHSNGTTIHVWTLVPNQGAFYASFKAGFSSVENLEGEKASCLIHVADNELNIIGVNAVNTEIYSVYGTLAMRTAKENTINVGHLANGVYIVVVYDKFGNRYVSKIAM